METVLEIVEDEETVRLANTLKSMLHTLPPLRAESCIYRVPYELRHVNDEAYTPMVVSIGPFHHGKESLQEMDVQKQRYLNDFRKRRPDLDLGYYVKKLKEFEERARNCYAENMDLSSDDFITMMLLDGCFIVEFLIKFQDAVQRNKDDPIFKSDVMINGILRDMVLLENQLPFFILEHLFKQIEFACQGKPFLEIALKTMDLFICNSKQSLDKNTYQAKHMVDLCLQYYTPMGTKLPPKTQGGIFRIPNASRLHEAGVKFTKCTRSGVKCLLDVKFTNGNLEIPTLEFPDHTETFLRNLVAYEQCDSKGNTQYFSEYIFLMDCLIDTPNDVELLTKAKIINNLLGDNKEVSQIFNKLGSGVNFKSDFYLRRLFEDVDVYSKKRRHAWRAKLKRNCFTTPWRSLSLAAAVILLGLAIIQSLFSILQFVLG